MILRLSSALPGLLSTLASKQAMAFFEMIDAESSRSQSTKLGIRVMIVDPGLKIP